jgi:hypothetical protein
MRTSFARSARRRGKRHAHHARRRVFAHRRGQPVFRQVFALRRRRRL